jgi:hypothetical protein
MTETQQNNRLLKLSVENCNEAYGWIRLEMMGFPCLTGLMLGPLIEIDEGFEGYDRKHYCWARDSTEVDEERCLFEEW